MPEYLIAYTGPRNGAWKYAPVKAGTASKAVDVFVDHTPNTFVKEVHEPVEWRDENGKKPNPAQYVIAYNGPRGGKWKYAPVIADSPAEASSRFVDTTTNTFVEQVYAPVKSRV